MFILTKVKESKQKFVLKIWLIIENDEKMVINVL